MRFRSRPNRSGRLAFTDDVRESCAVPYVAFFSDRLSVRARWIRRAFVFVSSGTNCPNMIASLLGLQASPVLLTGGQAADGTGGLISFVIPLVLVIGVFYLFIYRPQKKREEEHQDMVEDLKKGDKIVTIGGIHGTVKSIDDDSILAQVDRSGTKLRFDKQAIANVGGKDDDS